MINDFHAAAAVQTPMPSRATAQTSKPSPMYFTALVTSAPVQNVLPAPVLRRFLIIRTAAIVVQILLLHNNEDIPLPNLSAGLYETSSDES